MGRNGTPDKALALKAGDAFVRVVLPDGIGAVEIRTDLHDAEGHPRVRVDVVSDTATYGPDRHGRSWAPDNSSPGVVFLTGFKAGEAPHFPTCHECGRRARYADNGKKLCDDCGAEHAANGGDLRWL